MNLYVHVFLIIIIISCLEKEKVTLVWIMDWKKPTPFSILNTALLSLIFWGAPRWVSQKNEKKRFSSRFLLERFRVYAVIHDHEKIKKKLFKPLILNLCTIDSKLILSLVEKLLFSNVNIKWFYFNCLKNSIVCIFKNA